MAARRPMARATRIALFEREVRERLSRAALELVLGRAEVISEGQRGLRNGRDAYFGSTMLTIDLPSLELLLRDACDAGTARRLAELLEADAEAGARIEALAATRGGARGGRGAQVGQHARRDPLAGGEGVHRHRRRGGVFLGADVTEEASYSFGGAAKILDIPESKLRYWAQVGFVGPSGRRGGKPVFSFQDLVSVKAAKELTERGFKPAEIRKAIDECSFGPAARRSPAQSHPRRLRRHAPGGRRRRERVRADRSEGVRFRPRQSGQEDGRQAGGAGHGCQPSGPPNRATKPATPLPSAASSSSPLATPSATAFTAMRSAYDWFIEGTRAETLAVRRVADGHRNSAIGKL